MNGLEIKDLVVNIGDFKLNNINLVVPKGTILGLVGKNGAGKTTLIKAIAGGYNKTSGVIRLNGISSNDDEILYNKQHKVAYDDLNVNKALKPKQISKIIKKAFPDFDDVFYDYNLKKFHIDPNKRLVNNSLGANKKFSIILAMSFNPHVLILDEPTAGIDPSDKLMIIELIQTFLLNEANTVIYSTHIISDLEKIADYIALMDNGEIKFVKDKNELLNESYLVRFDENQLTNKLRSSMIGIRSSAFGFEAISTDKQLLIDNNIKFIKPQMEDILVHYIHAFEEAKTDERI